MPELHWPWMLLLLPLPWLLRRMLPAVPTRSESALRVPYLQQLRQLQPDLQTGSRQQYTGILLLALIWLCLCVALARPQWVGEPQELPVTGRDLMLAVDISGSMSQQDMIIGDDALDRLTAVKAVVSNFIRQRKGDRIGLILFGSHPYLQAPLTFDTDVIATLLIESRIGFAGKKTAIGDAIGLAVKRLRERPAESRVLILLSDGADTASTVSPEQAATLAASTGLKIYTVGVGAEEMVVPGVFGSRFGQRVVNPSRDLDEATLNAIATTTGGRYYRARNPAELARIYEDINRLEPVEQGSLAFHPRRSLLHWPLAAGSLLALLLMLSRSGLSLPGQRSL